jgi:hypothetical protein
MERSNSGWGLAVNLWGFGGLIGGILLAALWHEFFPPLVWWQSILLVVGLFIPWVWVFAWLMAKAKFI